MATRGYIGKPNADGTITAIYTHWDSYPTNNGKLILEHYNSEAACDEFIKNGSLSSMHERMAPKEGEEHSFDKPVEDINVFYHRDRGEDWDFCKPVTFKSEAEMIECEEFAYLWKDGKWWVGTNHKSEKSPEAWPTGKFIPLTPEVIALFQAENW